MLEWFFSRPPQRHEHAHQSTRHGNPRCYLVPCGHLHALWMFTINCPVGTHVTQVRVSPFCFSWNPRDFPTLLSPTPLTSHQWIPRNPLIPSPLILMYANCHSPEHLFHPLRFWFEHVLKILAQINSYKNSSRGWTFLPWQDHIK